MKEFLSESLWDITKCTQGRSQQVNERQGVGGRCKAPIGGKLLDFINASTYKVINSFGVHTHLIVSVKLGYS